MSSSLRVPGQFGQQCLIAQSVVDSAGLHSMRARFYDAWMGRSPQTEPVDAAWPNPSGRHRCSPAGFAMREQPGIERQLPQALVAVGGEIKKLRHVAGNRCPTGGRGAE